MARRRLEGHGDVAELLAELREPAEAMEIRVALQAADVRAEGERVTAAFKSWVLAGERQGGWQGVVRMRASSVCAVSRVMSSERARTLCAGEIADTCWARGAQAPAARPTGRWSLRTMRGGGSRCWRRAARRAGCYCGRRCTTQVRPPACWLAGRGGRGRACRPSPRRRRRLQTLCSTWRASSLAACASSSPTSSTFSRQTPGFRWASKRARVRAPAAPPRPVLA